MLRSLSTLAVPVWPPVALPQTVTEALQGTVTEATDASVSRAVVMVIKTATNAEFFPASTGASRYVAPFLQPGRHRAAVERPDRNL